MTNENRSRGHRWPAWGRSVAFAVFIIGLFHPLTRLIALGYGIGWAIVECAGAALSSSQRDKSGEA
jgi:hypothetical protein